MAHGSGGPWGPVDRHPRTSVAILTAAALVVAILVGVFAFAAGSRSEREQALREREHRAFQQAPAQFGANLDPEGNRHGGPLRISFIGASVTRGWFVTSLEQTYPAVASRTLARDRSRDVDYHVVALPGAPVEVALGWPVPRDQDMVVIHLVSDDFLYGTPVAAYEQHYLDLLTRIRKASPMAGFICLGDWGTPDAVNAEGAFAYTYEAIEMAACHRFGGIYTPISQDFEVPGARGPTGHPSLFGPALGDFHPNDYGDQLIAESVVASIDGDPPLAPTPTGPGTLAPPPVIPAASPGAQPTKREGHESHAAGPVPHVTEAPRVSPSPNP